MLHIKVITCTGRDTYKLYKDGQNSRILIKLLFPKLLSTSYSIMQKCFLLFLFVLLIPSVQLNAQQAPLWGSLESGKYSVGFKVLYVEDDSRSYSGLNGDSTITKRPLEIRMWYPAKFKSRALQMKYGDYLNYSLNHPSLTNRLLSNRSIQTTKSLLGQDTERFAKLKEIPVLAYGNAKPEKGKFPLLVYSMGLTDGWDENVVLWEYLASKGYVVLVSPSQGFSSLKLAFNQPNFETAARDMEILIEEGKKLPFVDGESIGALGFSYGGQVALYLAMRNKNIDAVAGIDPSFSHKTYLKTLTSAPFYNVKFKAPLLHIYNSYEDSDLSVVDSLKHAEQERLSFHDNVVGHVDFVSYTKSMTLTMPDSLQEQRQARTEAYEVICRKVGAFFDRHLKGSIHEGAASPLSSVLKNKMVEKSYKAVPVSPTAAELMQLLYENKVQEWVKEMEKIRTLEPSSPFLAVPAITSMSYELISTGMFEDALKVLHYGTSLHPKSAVMYDYVAEAYVRMNDQKKAIEAYSTLLQLAESDPYINEDTKNALIQSAKKAMQEFTQKS
ncbi:dienelactone hydrolase family protein [Pontibacter toksunensis]|uniref:Dienelactone hydrolase family protein n=1 Tax=Pontibacter toksunensis TaxID=1332631 RepID=A0ABW6C112_9BACT